MNTKTTSIIIGSIAVILLFMGGAFYIMGGIINTGSSIPPGLYWKVDKPIAIGKTLMFCPPNKREFQEARDRGYISAGNCPDNFGNMMLKVAAKTKDIVTINETGVYVNDMLLPQSKPAGKDLDGRPMPMLSLDHYELKDGELLLMSDATQEAFDGRYFGLIDFDQVDSVISPVF
jgi:conjugative transfer signal peptidase TraF